MTIFDVPYQLGQRNQLLKPYKLTYSQYQWIKRAFDLTICLVLLPFLILPMAAICLAILLDDAQGSPLFIQERIGRNGRRFKLFKFRTMRQNLNDHKHREFMRSYVAGKISDADDQGKRAAKFKPIRQEEITKVGKFLRKTSLDELPQLVNVIKGEMSLIGPRPNVPWEVEAYKPWHNDRLNVLPGITGLAQVMGRSDIKFDSIVRYDIQYVKNQGFHLDLWILGQTIKEVKNGNGAG
jgi:lipopolysaccharide/colanic/teichoic acid biosynthesis glycosyltransferase